MEYKSTKLLLLCGLILFNDSLIQAKPDKFTEMQTIFQEANKLYEQGNYLTALTQYEDLLNRYRYKTTELYYNLGNTYYKLQYLGKAILSYERAVRLTPRDEDLQYNLDFTYGLIKETRDKNFFYRIYHILNLDELTLITLIIYIFFIGLLSGTIIYRFVWTKQIGVVCGLVLFVFSSWWGLRFYEEQVKRTGIVISSPAEARTAPNIESEISFSVPEGKKVIILGEKEGWYAVGLTKERVKGWLEKQLITQI